MRGYFNRPAIAGLNTSNSRAFVAKNNVNDNYTRGVVVMGNKSKQKLLFKSFNTLNYNPNLSNADINNTDMWIKVEEIAHKRIKHFEHSEITKALQNTDKLNKARKSGPFISAGLSKYRTKYKGKTYRNIEALMVPYIEKIFMQPDISYSKKTAKSLPIRIVNRIKSVNKDLSKLKHFVETSIFLGNRLTHIWNKVKSDIVDLQNKIIALKNAMHEMKKDITDINVLKTEINKAGDIIGQLAVTTIENIPKNVFFGTYVDTNDKLAILEESLAREQLHIRFGGSNMTKDQTRIIRLLAEYLHQATFYSDGEDNTKNALNNRSYTTNVYYNAAYILENIVDNVNASFAYYFKPFITRLKTCSFDSLKLKKNIKFVMETMDILLKEHNLTLFLGLETMFGYNTIADNDSVNEDIQHWVEKKRLPEKWPNLQYLTRQLLWHSDPLMESKLYDVNCLATSGSAPGAKMKTEDETFRMNKNTLFSFMDDTIERWVESKQWLKDKYIIRTALKLEQIKTRHVASTDYESHIMFSLMYNLIDNSLNKKAMEILQLNSINTLNSPIQLNNALTKISKFKYKLTVDYSAMDHDVRKKHIIDLQTYLLSKIRTLYTSPKVLFLIDSLQTFTTHYLDNLYVITPDSTMEVKYQDGMLSGIKLTNLFESLINYCMTCEILEILTGKTGSLAYEIITMGDDLQGGTDDKIDLASYILELYKFGFTASPGKSRLSVTNSDFLRHVITQYAIFSYPLRAVSSVLYCKPWNEQRVLGPAEYLSNVRDLLYKCSISLNSKSGLNIFFGPMPQKRLVNYLKNKSTLETSPKNVKYGELRSVSFPMIGDKMPLKFSQNSSFLVSVASLRAKLDLPVKVQSNSSLSLRILSKTHKNIANQLFLQMIINNVPDIGNSMGKLNKCFNAMLRQRVHFKVLSKDSDLLNIIMTMKFEEYELLVSKITNTNLKNDVVSLRAESQNFIVSFKLTEKLLQKVLSYKSDISTISEIWGSIRDAYEPLSINSQLVNVLQKQPKAVIETFKLMCYKYPRLTTARLMSFRGFDHMNIF